MIPKDNLGYRRLRVFQEAHKLVLLVYKSTEGFPRSEMFGLTAQMRRSAVSVAANIVEGHARRSAKEFLQFLNMSNSSLVELEYYISLSKDLKLISDDQHQDLETQRIAVGNLLNGFTKSIVRKVRAPS